MSLIGVKPFALDSAAVGFLRRDDCLGIGTEAFGLIAPGFKPLGLLIAPFTLPPEISFVCVARLLPDAVASLPPRAVAPADENLPRLSLVYRRAIEPSL
jgi:hypothetical protein